MHRRGVPGEQLAPAASGDRARGADEHDGDQRGGQHPRQVGAHARRELRVRGQDRRRERDQDDGGQPGERGAAAAYGRGAEAQQVGDVGDGPPYVVHRRAQASSAR